MVEDLREQIVQNEDEFALEEEARKSRLSRMIDELAPWQRFLLTLLLFLNVALCGCMALVMAGRIMPPF
ncbi:MAG: hypothetical protein GX620_08250 [Chloroflexi bacterium]|nr:hypothetical protein [Chloroflexota bacterium]